jgi:hypothetical protein
MSKSIVLSAVVLGFCFAVTTSAIAKGPGNTAHPKTSPAKPSHPGHPKPGHPNHPNPGHPKPGHPGHPNHPNPGHPSHLQPGLYGNSGIYVVPGGASLPWQTVRYLRVSNQSGVTLTIFVQLTQDGPTHNWTVEPGVTTYLAIDGQKIAAAQVFIWAQSGDRSWTSARDGLTLVSEAYQAHDVAAFTYTFNP